MPRPKRSRKDVSVQQEDSSSPMQVDESRSGDSQDPSGFEAMDVESPQTPSTDGHPADEASPQVQSSGGSEQNFSGSARQSSSKGPTTSDERATSIVEIQTAHSTPGTTKSPSEPVSSSVEDVDQAATEMPRPAQSRGTGRQTRGRRGRRRRASGEQRGRGRGASHNFSHLDDRSRLLDELIDDPASVTNIVDQWICKYKVNKENATRMLIQFFVSSCGSSVRVTLETQTGPNHSRLIYQMTKNYYTDDDDYPIEETGRWKKFREIYSDFVSKLVHSCQHSIIYDQYLMDKVIDLLNRLTASKVRAYRHTSTLAVTKLMTALVEVAVTVSTNLANTRRQYESEQRKARSNRSTDRLENLEATRAELEMHMQELREMIDYIFESVFVRRYLDVATEIRAICFDEIGRWINKYPEMFFDDRHLEYISAGLWDEADEIRLRCLEILRPLYESEDFVPKLQRFTAQYKDRIVAMTLDRDFEAAAEAVRVVTAILKNRRDVLTDADYEKIYERVYSADRGVAHAAGEFVGRVFTVDENARIVRTKSGKARLPNTPLVRDLVAFFVESECPDHAVFLVDSLIETCPMMKDWECMTDLLLEDAGPDEEALNDKQKTSLVEIMVCCARQAATGEPPVGREPARKNVSLKRLKQIEEDRRRLSAHFVAKLAALLDAYGEDARKVVHLLELPQHFDLEIYRRSNQRENLDALMERMYDIVRYTHDTDVLETSAKTLATMCASIPERCEIARVVQLDYIVESYRAVNERYAVRENESATSDDSLGEETNEFLRSLRRVAVYYSLHDMDSYGLWEDLWKSLEVAKFSSGKLPEEAVRCCITACYYSILWSQNRLMKPESTGTRAMSEARLLSERLHSFIDLMVYFVGGDADTSSVASPKTVREDAYNTICDLLIFFNRTMLQHLNPVVHQLAYQPDDRVRETLNRFVLDNVFRDEPDDGLDEDSKVEHMFKRRNFLAGYCKLVMYNTVAIGSAIDVFKNYVKLYENYGDIVKETISRARDNSRVNCARTMLRSLLMSYDEMIGSGAEANLRSKEFTGIKTLAKKFARLFGFDAMKNSEKKNAMKKALRVLHSDGINFAVAPLDDADNDPTRARRNLPFLEILSEFSRKLSVDDRLKVLDYIENRFAGRLPLPRDGDWKPLYLYAISLTRGAADQVSITDRLFFSRSSTDHVAGGKEVDKADKESVNAAVGEPKQKRRSTKSKLPVTIVTHRRETGTSALADSNDTATMSASQIATIDDQFQDVHREIESRLESLEIDPQSPDQFDDETE